MSSRAFLNSFMLCPRHRARSGNFFAPNRMSTIRRMINKSGPPRFPIPKAKIFIFILNWSSSIIFQRTAKLFLMYRLLDPLGFVAFKMGENMDAWLIAVSVVAIAAFVIVIFATLMGASSALDIRTITRFRKSDAQPTLRRCKK